MQYGLLGQRLGHSYSPLIYRLLGLHGYQLFHMPPEDVEAFLGRGDLAGLNVTIPYKKVAARYCDSLSEPARRSGSVNTLVYDKAGRIHGHNTDYAGFLYTARRTGVSFPGRKVVILGNGGSAATVSLAARENDAREVVCISRRGEENYENLGRHADADILVNCTPVGMYPENDGIPVDLCDFPTLEGVLDLVYNPLRTRLLSDAEERGIPCAGGLLMLAEQGREAASYFLGREIPETETERIHSELLRTMENIVLIGMPGCGKNAVGQELARLMDRRLLDTDELVEAQTGRSPAEWIVQEGEEAFRDVEAKALKQAAAESGIVLATGGGAVLRAENRAAMRQNGRVYWLRRPLGELATEGRPLSKNLEELFRQRRGAYEAAAHREVGISGDAESAAHRIAEEFYESILA